MNSIKYLPLAALVTVLSGCSSEPHKDIPGLTSAIDQAVAGPYGQAIHHAEIAEDRLEDASVILSHWKNDHYWNIDESAEAMQAARDAEMHRLESEKAMCEWLTMVHAGNHHGAEAVRRTAAFFKTGSATPYAANEHDIAIIGMYLQSHPDATADVNAYTDTVGKNPRNQALSEKRAEAVSKMLIAHGAKAEQLHVKALGEASGPDNTPEQKNRTVSISTTHPRYIDCPKLKANHP